MIKGRRSWSCKEELEYLESKFDGNLLEILRNVGEDRHAFIR